VHETPRDISLVNMQKQFDVIPQANLLAQTFFKPLGDTKVDLGSKATQIMVGGTRYKIKAIRKKINQKDLETDLHLAKPDDDFDGFVYDFEEQNQSKKIMENINDGIKP
jgi:hypothetical protein